MKSLVFVYNADSGVFNRLANIAHKALSPATYSCSLCAVTHGHLGMRAAWREFLNSLPLHQEFLHRDEFIQRYRTTHRRFPALFARIGDTLRLLADADTINKCGSLEELQELVAESIESV